MQEQGAKRESGRLRAGSAPEEFALELANRTRWSAASLSGAPVPGIGDMARGILPEPYWAAAEQAVYAVYSYETPILWALADGTWQMPDHKYSASTNQQQSKMRQALASLGVEVEVI